MKLDARIPAGPLEEKWDRHLADLRLDMGSFLVP